MRPIYNSLRARITAPARVYTIPVRNSKLPGMCQMDADAEELWWARVWRDLRLPDPSTVPISEFRELVRMKHNGVGLPK